MQLFSRLYRFFGHSWPRAREALRLSGETSTSRLEARLRSRRLGRTNRYTEDTLRATLAQAVEHYKRPPSTAEFSWWREQRLALARAQGEDDPQVPSDNSYRRRWRTWEAALLHHGYTPEEVALRLEQRDQVFNTSADLYLQDDLPVAVLANDALEFGEAGLSADEAQRVRETYEAMPRRTRYILTVRLGLGGVPKQILRDVAEPLGGALFAALALAWRADHLVTHVGALFDGLGHHLALASHRARHPGARHESPEHRGLLLVGVEGLRGLGDERLEILRRRRGEVAHEIRVVRHWYARIAAMALPRLVQVGQLSRVALSARAEVTAMSSGKGRKRREAAARKNPEMYQGSSTPKPPKAATPKPKPPAPKGR